MLQPACGCLHNLSFVTASAEALEVVRMHQLTGSDIAGCSADDLAVFQDQSSRRDIRKCGLMPAADIGKHGDLS